MSTLLCRIWSRIKNLHRTAVAEARGSYFHVFYVEALRKHALQEFIMLSHTVHRYPICKKLSRKAPMWRHQHFCKNHKNLVHGSSWKLRFWTCSRSHGSKKRRSRRLCGRIAMGPVKIKETKQTQVDDERTRGLPSHAPWIRDITDRPTTIERSSARTKTPPWSTCIRDDATASWGMVSPSQQFIDCRRNTSSDDSLSSCTGD